MKKIIFVILCLSFALTNPAQAKKKTETAPLTGVVQDVQAATLENGSEEIQKPKKHKAVKHKKSHKAKKQ